MIAVRDLDKRYGNEKVLESIDLDIEPGGFVSLLGPSGCGKSTLLRLVADLEHPSSGSIEFQQVDEATEQRPRIAFVFQESNLLPWRSVHRNVSLPFELDDRLPNVEQADRVAECLELVGLRPQDARKLPRQLSGGMKMRVSLARALVTQPQVMLMDEPFAALDDMLRQQLNEDVVRLWQMQNWTTIFVTHNVAEAVFLSREVLIMSRHPGRIVKRVEVPFGDSRPFELRSSAEFAQFCGEVSNTLRESAG